MKLLSYKEWFEQQTMITEMSVERKKAETVINGLGDEIFKHLIKVLYWVDEVNYNKHIKDINGWINKTQKLDLKPNSKRIKEQDYYDWLYDEFNSSPSQLSSTIKRDLRDYHNLPRTEITEDELYKLLKSLYVKLAKDLHLDKFEDVEDYL